MTAARCRLPDLKYFAPQCVNSYKGQRDSGLGIKIKNPVVGCKTRKKNTGHPVWSGKGQAVCARAAPVDGIFH